MLPVRYAPALFSLILSGWMSLVVSAISTFRATGPGADFLSLWLGAWLTAWLIAFPLVLLVAPVTRRIVQGLVGAPAGPGR
ncbi:MAG: DUF2798 domain-containing protein [Hylemonella sp.]|nr:DUF2798 domain-containing protein [Hylemonella sp.]